MLFRARSLGEAIEIANDTPFGLAASAWTRDPAEQQRLVAEIQAGAVFLNKMVASDPRLPFGGIKHSGYGRELSAAGMREFLNAEDGVCRMTVCAASGSRRPYPKSKMRGFFAALSEAKNPETRPPHPDCSNLSAGVPMSRLSDTGNSLPPIPSAPDARVSHPSRLCLSRWVGETQSLNPSPMALLIFLPRPAGTIVHSSPPFHPPASVHPRRSHSLKHQQTVPHRARAAFSAGTRVQAHQWW